MFTYLDPSVRERLAADGKLLQLDSRGGVVAPGQMPTAAGHSIALLGPIPLPLRIAGGDIDVDWYVSVRHTELAKVEELAQALRDQGGQRLFAVLATSMAVNSVLVIGDPAAAERPLVRVHSSCVTGDVFGSQRCECGPQLTAALQRIAGESHGGLLIYMAGHEGRGIGLWAKAATYVLQDAGEDTYQANRSLGLPDDSRDFSDAAALLGFFVGDRPFRLLTNNLKKVDELASHGLNHIEAVKHVTGVTRWNRRYMRAKQDWGHQLSDDDLIE